MDRSCNQEFIDRREFFRNTTAAALAGGLPLSSQTRQKVNLVIEPGDEVASGPIEWSLRQLQNALEAAGHTVQRRFQPLPNEFSIVVSGPRSTHAAALFRYARITLPDDPESLALFHTKLAGQDSLVACGRDWRGLAYALGELTDRLRNTESLTVPVPIVESPANSVRSVMRQFTSELLDKPWFYDREQWTNYLDMLARYRWNRLHLAFGLGYDTLNHVDDGYFLFIYPFFVSLPGYKVTATNLSDSERIRNLDTLRFISEQSVARGIDFQLGVWMHGYQYGGGKAQNVITGLTPETHAPYCRDALTVILRHCPGISSIGLRIHGESGVAEGSYDFWATVFDGVKRCGRRVEIDLHAKGIDKRMIAQALATGMPVNVSPKYWAEHFGMPYHQAAIRDNEMPVTGHTGAGLMTLSEGARVFTRYGYADLLREDRKYNVRHRVFAGTQRILLWDDPVSTAAHSRAFQFCGSTGTDLMEPLTCRGRRGSAVPGRRSGYADDHLEPKWDWQKYDAWYQVWGRLLYNPATDVTRGLQPSPQANALRSALACASRILPIVTTAYLPSAACDAYWPEIYWNQPLVAEPKPNPYGDTAAPKVFQNSSALDPQLFLGMRDFAQELLAGERSGKYSPVEVAAWLDDWASKALQHLAEAETPANPDLERIAIDTRIQACLGQFFASKFRAGVFYALFESTGHKPALEASLTYYRSARVHWAKLSGITQRVYAVDLSVSDRFDERGQWQDRLAGIDQDIAAVEKQLAAATSTSMDDRAATAFSKALQSPRRGHIGCRHTPPETFRRGKPVHLAFTIDLGSRISSVKLFYRHVNQAERYQTANLEAHDNRLLAEIPAGYTDSPFPLQYYLELRSSPGDAWLYPGLDAQLTNQPYFVLRAPVFPE